MTKKRNRPTVEEVLARTWCYYCERDFDDVQVLIGHQKIKHFKCTKCNRKLNTAGGLSVHMNQVHKETLSEVANAIEGRREPNIEIFGMEGIPEELMNAHKQRITNAFFAMEAEHRAKTGNPPPGAGSNGEPNSKRVKVVHETPEELKARLAEHRARRKAEKEAKAAGISIEDVRQEPATAESPPSNADQPTSFTPQPVFPHDLPPHLPQSLPHSQGFPPQPQSFPPQIQGFPPQPQGFPPQPQGFPPAFSPVHGFPPPVPGLPVFPPPQQSPYGASPYGLPAHHSPMPPAPLHSPMAAAPRHSPRPGPTHGFAPPTDGPPRQHSLPSAPGLPARPTFNSPNLSREEMQRMHEGQGPSAPKTGAYPTYQAPPHQQQQPVAPQPPYVPQEMDCSVEELIRSVKNEIREKAQREQERAAAAQTAKPTKYMALDGAQDTEGNGASDGSTKPEVLPLTKSKKSKKASKHATVKLLFDDNGTWISPEEKMAALSKYAFTRQNGAEYTLSEVGGAVTGTERGENDVVDPVH